MKPFTKKLVLENGREFYGYGYGADVERVGEIVFNTSVVGYQEIISDPSCMGQIVVMAYPLIGNYGITDEDFESKQPLVGGMVVRECNENPSNFRYTKTFSETLDEQGIPPTAEGRFATKMLIPEMTALITAKSLFFRSPIISLTARIKAIAAI